MAEVAQHSVHDRPDVQAAMRAAIERSKDRGGCAAGCGVPMDPVLLHEGWRMHPSCEFPALAWTEAERLAARRDDGRRRRQRRSKPLPGTVFYRPQQRTVR